MPLSGTIRLVSALTTAGQDDWANIVYPDQGGRSAGVWALGALRAIGAACVVAVDVGAGRIVVSSDSGVMTALRALPPSTAAVATPVLEWGKTATQWTLVSDEYSYGGGQLPTICLPQLSKRTLAAFLDRALSMDPQTGFAVADQDSSGSLKLWSDWDRSASTDLSAITPAGLTVAVEFMPVPSLLPFEGGEV